MNKNNWILLVLCALMGLSLQSCKEDDGTVEEFPNWQTKNEAFVQTLATDSMTQSNWVKIEKYSLSASATGAVSDYIYVHKMADSTVNHSSATPLYTDSVSIHYRGTLLPSTSYPKGYVFDTTYSLPFDATISRPTTLVVSSLITGFSTAVQKMHQGDHWIIYIPYQLGYGTTTSSTIPAYSTLIFDVRLVKSWRVKLAS
jgi:FKBP-type peptidyl-prolyl cis-trans isomerase FklB